MNNDPLGLFDDEQSNDPLGLFSDSDEKTSFGEDIGISMASVKNTFTKAGGLGLGAFASALGDTAVADEIYQDMEQTTADRMKAANPQGKQQSFGGKAAGMLATLPAQMVAMPFSPFDTGQEMIEKGESLGTAQAGAAIDAAFNALGAGLPGAVGKSILGKTVSGGLINAAQDTLARGAISGIADTKEIKDQFGPNPETAALAAIPGAGFGAAHGAVSRIKNKKAAAAEEAKLAKLEELSAAKPTPTPKDPLGIFSEEGFDGQMSLFDQADQMGQRNQFNAGDLGDWRVDENGIPVRVDLSMEAANMEAPLQRNLWGDERQPVSDQQGRPLTEAIDETQSIARNAEDLETADVARQTMDAQLDLLRGEIPATGELRTAKMEADGPLIPRGDRPSLGVAKGKQRGALDPSVFKEGYRKLTQALSDLTDQSWVMASFPPDRFMTNQDGTPQILLHGTTANIKGGLRGSDQGFHAGSPVSAHMFVQDEGPMHGKSLYSSKRTRENAAIYPLVIKKGNYPKLGFDVGNWSPKRLLTHPEFNQWMRFEYDKHGLSEASYRSDKNYILNAVGDKEANQRLSDILKSRLSVDGFYYKNAAESANTQSFMKAYQRGGLEEAKKAKQLYHDPEGSFVTWNDKNFQSVYDRPSTEPAKKPTPMHKKQQGWTLQRAGKKNPLEQVLGKNKDGNFIPDDPDVDERLAIAQTEKDGKSARLMDSGASLTAMKRASTAVATAGELIQNAFKRSDLNIRKEVMPAEDALRSLNESELTAVGELLKMEMIRGERFDGSAMLEAGFTDKQLVAYKKLREMFDGALKIQNEARAAKGQKPIDPIEAYLSSRWQGDFRLPVYQAVLDENGNPKVDAKGNLEKKLVWYLAADTKAGLKAQAEGLKSKFPDLEYNLDKNMHVVRFWNRKTDFESAYSTMVDILGRDDPAVKKMQEYMKDTTVGQGATFLNQEKHFKKKGNIRGFVGDRPDQKMGIFTKERDPLKETLAMMQQQIQYAKNAHRWSELQKAGQGIKELITDPYLIENQPNNIKYIRDYYKNAIGYGESRAIRAIEDSIRDVGVSPVPFDKAIGGMKSFFILQKLAINAGYAAANAVQFTMMLPHMVDLAEKGYGGNPAKAIAAGMLGGIVMGTGHIATAVQGKTSGKASEQFFSRAYKYAEDNGITARSIYDESPVDSAFSTTGKVAHVLGKSMTIPETYLRSAVFMTFAQYLKDSGKFKDEASLFRMAEERTNVAMVDYASTERPMVFSKMGTAGNFLNTLQTYSFNFYNQYKYFYNEALKGNPLPLMTALTVQTAVAGVMGAPGAEDLYKGYMMLKDNVLSAKQWAKAHSNPFFSDPKLWALENWGQSTVYGAVSDKSGLGLSSRIVAPSATAAVQSPLGPITDIGKQIGNLGSAILDPTNTDKWAQSAMSSAPVGLAGLLETSGMMEGKTYEKRPDGTRVYGRNTDIADHRGEYSRTPEQDKLRKYGMGLRSQEEVVKRDVAYSTNRADKAAREHATGLVDSFYSAVKRSDMDKAKELFETYTYLTGKKISKEQFMGQVKENYLTAIEKAQTGPKTVKRMQDIARMEALFDKLDKDNQ